MIILGETLMLPELETVWQSLVGFFSLCDLFPDWETACALNQFYSVSQKIQKQESNVIFAFVTYLLKKYILFLKVHMLHILFNF